MRPYGDQAFKTYHDMCYERGLLSDEREWRKFPEEADMERNSRSLRKVFAIIIAFNSSHFILRI